MKYLLVKNSFYEEHFTLIDKFNHVSDAKSYAKEHFNINELGWIKEKDFNKDTYYYLAYDECQIEDSIRWNTYCIIEQQS